MRWIVALLILALGAWAFGLWRHSVVTARLERALPEGAAGAPDLPPAIRAFAEAGGGTATARPVRLRQAAEMRLKRGGPWQPLQARQTIATTAPGFVWAARQSLGPIPKFAVLDSHVAGAGRLQVWLLGAFRIADATGPEMDEGELLRYLAELPWAPDAILSNGAIAWTDEGDGRYRAAVGDIGVTFTMGGGEIVGVTATGRPATDESGRPTRMDWSGRFSDYGWIGGRRIPKSAEVGYVWSDGVYEAYFRGRITGYAAE